MQIETGSKKRSACAFLEDLLFTHRGLRGPAVLQISSYWQPGAPLTHRPRARAWTCARPLGRGQAALAQAHRQRTRRAGAARGWPTPGSARTPALAAPDQRGSATATLAALAERIARWQLTPSGTEGYRKAEVTAGGVDTRELVSQTMEAEACPACTSSARWST